MGLTLTNEATNKVASFNHKIVKEINGDYTVLPEDGFLVLSIEASQFGNIITLSPDLPVGAVVTVFNRNPDGYFNFLFTGSEEIETTQLTDINFKTASIIKVNSTTWKYIYGYKVYPSTAALEEAIQNLLTLIQDNTDAISGVEGNLSTQEEVFNAFKQKADEFEASINTGVAQLEADVSTAFNRFDELSDEITALAGLTDLYNREIVAYSAQETLSRQQADTDLLMSIADSAAARDELNRRRRENERLIDAAVYIDPDNGEIVNRAFSFTEEYFTQASLRIDGVEGEINAAVARIDLSETDIENLYSELELLPGVISATAQSVVAQNISALNPAHSFNFFDSAQGWVAVRGTVVEDLGYISTTFGDIENTSLNYNGLEDPAIRVQCKRTAGTGFAGDIEITDSDNTKNYISGVIPNDLLDGEYVFLIIDMEGFANYQKDITGLRLILGESISDEFDIKSIVIGKKDALLQEFNELTGRVTNAEFRIDAVEGQIKQKLDVTTYNQEGVTISNVSSVLDGVDSYIELKALRQEIDLNGTVTKANAAAIDIDALENTITQSVESFNLDIDGLDTRVTSALQEISELRVRQQIIGIGKTTGDFEQDIDFLKSLSEQSLREYVINTKAKTAALAIEDLEVEISPTGSIGKRILDLESVTNTLDGLITANLREIQIVATDLDGNTQASQQLELEVQKLNGEIEGALTEINSVKIDADDNAEAISGVKQSLDNEVLGLETKIQTINNNLITIEDDLATTVSALTAVEGAVNDENTGINATYLLAQQAKTASTGNTSSITAIKNDIKDLEDDVQLNATFAQQVKNTADGNKTSITTIQNRLDDGTTGLAALSQTIQGVESDVGDNVTALNEITNKINDPDTGLSILATTLSAVEKTADDNATAINGIETKIDDPDTGLTGLNSFIQTVQTDANSASADATQALLDAAQASTKAINAAKDANTAINTLSDISSDDKLTPTEKIRVKTELDIIEEEYSHVISEANKFGVSTTAYIDAYDLLFAYFVDRLADLTTTANVNGVAVRNRFTSYFAKKQQILNSITSEAKRLADAAQDTADVALSATTTLEARLDNNDDFVSSQLTLNSTYNALKDSFDATAKLITDNNGYIAGVDINNNGSASTMNLKADAVKFLNSNNEEKIYFDAVNNRFVFKGHIEAETGDYSGDLSGNTITGAEVYGSKFSTSNSTATRIEVEDDGTYLIWAGSGTKTDSNGTFWIKKNGTGYIKGSFFEGGIVESQSATGVYSASVNHKSAGKNVSITIGSSGSAFVNTSNAPSGGTGTSTYLIDYTVKRGSSTLESGKIAVTREVRYEQGEYLTVDTYSFGTSFIDDDTGSSTYTYEIEIGTLSLSTRNQKCSISTFENILS